MRRPEFVSPTAFFLWKKDKEDYYKRYLSDRRFEKEPQTIYMGIGSAFDTLLKNKMITDLKIDRPLININEQVELPIREEAVKHGENVLKFYLESSAYTELLREIGSNLRLEFGVKQTIEYNGKSFPAYGKPDCYYLTCEKVPVVNDWKVNGWLTKASPKPGYIDLFPERKCHKDALRTFGYGIHYNLNGCRDAEWMIQEAIYGWLLGCPVGEPIIGGIEQIVGGPPRLARHRFFIGKDFQISLFKEIVEFWETIQSEHIFRDLTPEQSISRCKALEEQVSLGI